MALEKATMELHIELHDLSPSPAIAMTDLKSRDALESYISIAPPGPPIKRLPTLLLSTIFTYLPVPDLITARCVSKHWRAVLATTKLPDARRRLLELAYALSVSPSTVPLLKARKNTAIKHSYTQTYPWQPSESCLFRPDLLSSRKSYLANLRTSRTHPIAAEFETWLMEFPTSGLLSIRPGTDIGRNTQPEVRSLLFPLRKIDEGMLALTPDQRTQMGWAEPFRPAGARLDGYSHWPWVVRAWALKIGRNAEYMTETWVLLSGAALYNGSVWMLPEGKGEEGLCLAVEWKRDHDTYGEWRRPWWWVDGEIKPEIDGEMCASFVEWLEVQRAREAALWKKEGVKVPVRMKKTVADRVLTLCLGRRKVKWGYFVVVQKKPPVLFQLTRR